MRLTYFVSTAVAAVTAFAQVESLPFIEWKCMQSEQDDYHHVFVANVNGKRVCAGVGEHCDWYTSGCPETPANGIAVVCPDAPAGPAWCKEPETPKTDTLWVSGVATRFDPFDPQQNHGHVNIGSCDNVVTSLDTIVAINAEQYDDRSQGNEWCRRRQCIEIQDMSTGKTARAVIGDRCASCGYGNIDLTWGTMHALDKYQDGTFGVRWRLC